MQDWMKLLIAAVIGYVFGSFNPAILFSRLFAGTATAPGPTPGKKAAS